MGGTSNGSTMYKDIWYSGDPTLTNSWTEAPLPPWSARSGFASVVYDNKLWILGGYTAGNVAVNDIWYSDDPARPDSWRQASSLPWTPRGNFTANVHNNKILIIGGGEIWSGSITSPVVTSLSSTDLSIVVSDTASTVANTGALKVGASGIITNISTAVNSGIILTPDPLTTSGAIGLDFTKVQKRGNFSCSSTVMSSIGEDGSVFCIGLDTSIDGWRLGAQYEYPVGSGIFLSDLQNTNLGSVNIGNITTSSVGTALNTRGDNKGINTSGNIWGLYSQALEPGGKGLFAKSLDGDTSQSAIGVHGFSNNYGVYGQSSGVSSVGIKGFGDGASARGGYFSSTAGDLVSLEVAGKIKITGGNPIAGKVLVSEGNGVGSWGDLPTAGTCTINGNTMTCGPTSYTCPALPSIPPPPPATALLAVVRWTAGCMGSFSCGTSQCQSSITPGSSNLTTVSPPSGVCPPGQTFIQSDVQSITNIEATGSANTLGTQVSCKGDWPGFCRP